MRVTLFTTIFNDWSHFLCAAHAKDNYAFLRPRALLCHTYASETFKVALKTFHTLQTLCCHRFTMRCVAIDASCDMLPSMHYLICVPFPYHVTEIFQLHFVKKVIYAITLKSEYITIFHICNTFFLFFNEQEQSKQHLSRSILTVHYIRGSLWCHIATSSKSK